MADQLHHELRHLKSSKLTYLSTIIDQSKSYIDLLNYMSSGRFPALSITLESAHLIKRQPSPTLALLSHWAITGRRRPTVKDLIELLRVCDLKRAEAYVMHEILGLETQTPAITHAEESQQSDHFSLDTVYKFDKLTHVVTNISDQCIRYSFEQIYKSTNRFCHKPLDVFTSSGSKIGDGRFSSVFLARTSPEDSILSDSQDTTQIVAAKLLKSECNLKYLVNEINLAKKLDHESILELLGVSIGQEDGDLPRYMCLIYPYMQNGSLADCLNHGLRLDQGQRVPWKHRITMALKVAEGISYLHSFHEGVIIHRDVKSANILIDENLNPKLGDFTLVRQLDSFKQGQTEYSQNIIGTSVYMPPEAFRGDISTKFDVFSFGIVILELLTGLKPFNDETGEDLLTHISDRLSDIEEKPEEMHMKGGSEFGPRYKFLANSMDRSAGEWDIHIAGPIFDLALKATEVRKRDRPEISDILSGIRKLINK